MGSELAITHEECDFCSALAGYPRKWYDRVLWETRGFGVFVSSAPFFPCSLMIMPRSHVYRVAQLPQHELEQLEAIIADVRAIVARVSGEPRVAVFEHGQADGSGPRPACVEHAHIHVMPIRDIDILPNMLGHGDEVSSVSRLTVLRDITGPYFYLDDDAVGKYVGRGEYPSQFVRRLLAASRGDDMGWDYALGANEDLVRWTLDRMTPWPT